MIDGSAREIIGVLPKDFWFMDVGHDLVLPLRFNRAGVRLEAIISTRSPGCVPGFRSIRRTPISGG